MPPKVNYTGVLLDDASKEELRARFFNQIPGGWNWSGDHMTIAYGKDATLKAEDDGKVVPLTATHIGKSDDAWALKVDGYKLENKIPHVTLAYRNNAADSNNISVWKDIDHLPLKGKLGTKYHGGRRKTRRAVNKLKNTLRRRMSRRA
jgi:hypothetical protein